MKAVIQRVKLSSVSVAGEIVGKINQGLLILLGITHDDTRNQCDWLANKIINMRIFSDSDDKLNLSVKDIAGGILVISQFTLYAEAEKGNRPSFTNAARPEIAKPLYEYFIDKLRANDISVESGIFGADMQVELINDGPITIMLEK
ncbi:D-aminoacyl-tRNA deacylase [Aquella oligotrophica]|uniref:D-aminoacyl-tRNA deacylase n=1 Tax=Aquella oligotrophica TaxID=2067065 RepID=A0A2I7N319_9NEIS|nr:D-aminoacyl-tRNA deacylase [Aquella oligotrophica]AUR50853.1 D-tyrosyl-tRNA(Tyr) deacylase [Aquella oligotrophica]